MPAPQGPDLRLFEAAEAGDVAAAREAIGAGADVNARHLQLEGRTPLNSAVAGGHLPVVKLLLSRGAQVGLGAFSNLAAAFDRDDVRVLEALVKAGGGDPNDFQDAEDPPWKTGFSPRDTPLIRAVRQGRYKVAAKLLELGADPNRLDREGFCALAVARLRKDKKLQKLLEPATDPALREQASRASEVKARRKRQDRFIEAARDGNFDVVRSMLAEGIDVDMEGDTHGDPALVDVAWRGNLEMLKLLVEAGASPGGRQGSLPLAFAARSTNPEVTRYLLECGADPNAFNGDLGPPILEAAAHGNVEAVRLLLRHGADPSLANGWGQTAMSSLDKRRSRPIWQERREAYEQIEQLLTDAIARRSAADPGGKQA